MVMAIRLVATDIDGTITLHRGNLLLSQEAIEAIRKLEENGITVSLVSGNSVPVTAGLARYIGARGPSIAENGCVIFYKGERYHICRGRPGLDLVGELLRLGFRESWQNIYRHHDLAFYPPASIEAREKGILLAREKGYKAFDSGYAIHILPSQGGKDQGLRKVMEMLGLEPGEVLAVGDGGNDLPLLEEAGYSACPADADEAVKRVANYIASKPGGSGFAEIAELVLAGRIP